MPDRPSGLLWGVMCCSGRLLGRLHARLGWIADVEARISNGEPNVTALPSAASESPAELDKVEINLEERRTGAWMKSWRRDLEKPARGLRGPTPSHSVTAELKP